MSIESFVELKYFSPYNPEKLPAGTWEAVYKDCYNKDYDPVFVNKIPCEIFLILECDPKELERGVKRALIKYEETL